MLREFNCLGFHKGPAEKMDCQKILSPNNLKEFSCPQLLELENLPTRYGPLRKNMLILRIKTILKR